jgi:hypothetical protein
VTLAVAAHHLATKDQKELTSRARSTSTKWTESTGGDGGCLRRPLAAARADSHTRGMDEHDDYADNDPALNWLPSPRLLKIVALFTILVLCQL